MLIKFKFILNTLAAVLVMFIIMTNFVFADVAKNVGGNQSANVSSQVVMMLFIFVAMYFLLIRPQSKKAKEHKDLLRSLHNGNEVITVGGLLGTIIKVIDNFVVLAIADGVKVAIQKQAIAQVLPRGTIDSLSKTSLDSV